MPCPSPSCNWYTSLTWRASTGWMARALLTVCTPTTQLGTDILLFSVVLAVAVLQLKKKHEEEYATRGSFRLIDSVWFKM